MSTVQLFGYLRGFSSLKPHQLLAASDVDLADAAAWSVHDWRDDPDWICVAIGQMTIERLPSDEVSASAVAALRQKQVEVRAEFEARIVEIDRQINSLLAIAHEVAP